MLTSKPVVEAVVISAVLILGGGWLLQVLGIIQAHGTHTILHWVMTVVRVLVLIATLIVAIWALVEIMPFVTALLTK